MKKYLIAPSILSADIARLGEEVESVLNAGANLIHVDVMDNHYVPNLTIGPLVVKSLRKYGITAPLDVHLMTKPVDSLIQMFAEAGASAISFHPEATEHVDRSLQMIRDYGIQAGLALNPATPLTWLENVIHQLDFVLIMTVNPGFGGQKFIPAMLSKIKKCKEMIDASGLNIHIAVDGGVNLETIADIAKAGADTFIAGTAIFGEKNYKKAIENLRKVLK